ncbi:hypothetical protein RHMOL_RhmolUnG0004600 [Rhododendron molle]|nr:hypothetical protein RHMOL_RhmolUnG0004600 [Rhododendron molle]
MIRLKQILSTICPYFLFVYPLLPAVGTLTQRIWTKPARLWYSADGRGSPDMVEPHRSDLVLAPTGGFLTYLITSSSTRSSSMARLWFRAGPENGSSIDAGRG